MKKNFFIFVVSVFALSIFALDLNSLIPTGWVNDYAGIIDYNSKQKINSIITELNNKTSAEIVVVTLKTLEGENIENFANRLFEKWGVGKKGKNNGVMILIAQNERKIRIEIGYGIEGIIPDAKAGRIIRDIMAPFFREVKYGEGVLNAVYFIATEIANDAGVKLNIEKRNINYNQKKLTKSDLIWFLFFMIFVLPIFIRHPWLFLLFLSSSSGGRYSGGGFGGGFGGFGGGLSGGGGATGRW